MQIDVEQLVNEMPQVLIRRIIKQHGLKLTLEFVAIAEESLHEDGKNNLLSAEVCDILIEQSGRLQ